jgi:hypothetical protein
MDLTDIITISGKSGLYTIIGQTKNNVIVESIVDGKRFPTFSSNRISALKDISIYTNDGEASLSEIYRKIHEKENGKTCISHNDPIDKVYAYLEDVLPDYDKEQVYTSDIKKLFQWYNILHKANKLKLKEDNKPTETEDKKTKEPVKEEKSSSE